MDKKILLTAVKSDHPAGQVIIWYLIQKIPNEGLSERRKRLSKISASD